MNRQIAYNRFGRDFVAFIKANKSDPFARLRLERDIKNDVAFDRNEKGRITGSSYSGTSRP